MRWPLRHQIMLPLLAVAATSLATVGALNAQLTAKQTRERIERQLQGVVTVLATSNFPLSDAVLRQMRDLSSAEFVLTDAAGAARATSLVESPEDLPKGDEQTQLDNVVLGPSVNLKGRKYFHTVTELPARTRTEGVQLLHVLFPEQEYRRTLWEAFLPSLLVGLAAIFAMAVVARVLAGRLSRATSRLGGEVLRMARGDFTPAELPATDDEIRDLSIAINRTAEMLADYERQIRRTEQMRVVSLLGAGLAHEMRNAATGCRMALDLHAEQYHEYGDDESLSVAKRQLRLMESQLQRFLRAGKPLEDSVKREIDFAGLVENLLPLVHPAMQHAGIEFQWIPPRSMITVVADQEALGQAVLNLMLNAIEAVQKLGRQKPRQVTVALNGDEDGYAQLYVTDSGLGPKESLEDALFDPFVTSKAEGVGLGLAVVKEIVDSHRGTIGWTRNNGSTSFRMVIPLATKGDGRV